MKHQMTAVPLEIGLVGFNDLGQPGTRESGNQV
jgi:hypothetical protein